MADACAADEAIAIAVRMRIRTLADQETKMARCMDAGALENGDPVVMSDFARNSMIAMYEGTALELIRLSEALEVRYELIRRDVGIQNE